MNTHPIKTTTRGGQVVLHNLRMISQVLQKVIWWLFPVGLLASVGWFFLITSPAERQIGWQGLLAELHWILNGSHFQQSFVFPNGRTIMATVETILASPLVRNAFIPLKEAFCRSLVVGLAVWLGACFGVLIWLRTRGEKATAHQPLKGDQLLDVETVKTLLRSQRKTSDLVFGYEALPLPLASELQHLLVHGTTGTGKSTVIKSLLDHIRRRRERAIIYDKSCSLVSQFYQPVKDILLNPLDERGAAWSLWPECRDKADFDNLAAAFIPMAAHTTDPFWIHAARTLFSAAACRFQQSHPPRILPLLHSLLTADLTQLQTLLRGTEAESLMSEKTEKTALSIKSVLATYLKSLCYVSDQEKPFSIRQWMQDDRLQSWLFISSTGDRHETLRPLITAWLDIAINALLSLPEKPSRRIWIILDELGSLQQVPYLTSALAEARKFGGCFVIGVQSIAQLSQIYGSEGAKGNLFPAKHTIFISFTRSGNCLVVG